eukprot:PhF_6_TR33800/c0_g1_i1/m.49572
MLEDHLRDLADQYLVTPQLSQDEILHRFDTILHIQSLNDFLSLTSKEVSSAMSCKLGVAYLVIQKAHHLVMVEDRHEFYEEGTSIIHYDNHIIQLYAKYNPSLCAHIADLLQNDEEFRGKAAQVYFGLREEYEKEAVLEAIQMNQSLIALKRQELAEKKQKKDQQQSNRNKTEKKEAAGDRVPPWEDYIIAYLDHVRKGHNPCDDIETFEDAVILAFELSAAGGDGTPMASQEALQSLANALYSSKSNATAIFTEAKDQAMKDIPQEVKSRLEVLETCNVVQQGVIQKLLEKVTHQKDLPATPTNAPIPPAPRLQNPHQQAIQLSPSAVAQQPPLIRSSQPIELQLYIHK